MGILPYAGVDIALFELLKEQILEHHEVPPPHLLLGAGMLSRYAARGSVRLSNRLPASAGTPSTSHDSEQAFLQRVLLGCQLAPSRSVAHSTLRWGLLTRACLCSSVAQTVAYPLGFVRTRLQVRALLSSMPTLLQHGRRLQLTRAPLCLAHVNGVCRWTA